MTTPERYQHLRAALEQIENLAAEQPDVDRTRAMFDIAHNALVADDTIGAAGDEWAAFCEWMGANAPEPEPPTPDLPDPPDDWDDEYMPPYPGEPWMY